MLLQDLRFALRSLLRAPRFTVPALALGLVAAFASYLPARRGMRVTPEEALRAE